MPDESEAARMLRLAREWQSKTNTSKNGNVSSESEAGRTLRLAKEAQKGAGVTNPLKVTLIGLGIFFSAIVVISVTVSNYESHRKRPEAATESSGPSRLEVTPKSVPTVKPQDSASIFTERVETYWLPEVEALPNAAPAGGPEYGRILTQLDGLRSYAADGKKLTLRPDQAKTFAKFSLRLSAKQRSLLPSFRRRYSQMLNDKLFRRDISVSVAGARADTLRITGALFAANANIEDMQMELAPVLQRMRFRHVEYRWYRQASDPWVYKLEAPTDGDVSAP